MMAKPKTREYGKLSVNIWQHMIDADLSRDARLVFPMLIAQKKITLCGSMELRMRRWAKFVAMTEDELEVTLQELEDVGWIAVDHNTEELILCGFVKHDLLIANRNHRLGMWRALDKVESERLHDIVVENLPPKIYSYDDDEGLDPPPGYSPEDPSGSSSELPPRDPSEPPPEDPSGWASRYPSKPPSGYPYGSTGDPIPETGDTKTSSSSPRAGSREPVDNSPDDDWVTNQAREHIEAHIEFRADAIEYPKAVARSQIPRAVELIRDVLAEDGDVYDIDDALETEWPTFDELYEPTKPASVRRLHDRLKVIA